MEMEELLKSLIDKEKKEEKKVIFETLYKCSNQVFFCDKKDCFFPFLYIKGDRIVFTFMHEELDNLPYVYTDLRDIHTILQFIFYEKFNVYLCYEESIHLSHQEIWEKIDQALESGDQEAFKYYASFIK